MSTFTTELDYHDLPPDYRRSMVDTEFEYHVGKYPSHEVIVVPKGFITDWASVPRALWSVIPPRGEYSKAVLVHDWMYVTAYRTRKIADRIFLEAMKVLGVKRWKRRLMYIGVRIGGRGNY